MRARRTVVIAVLAGLGLAALTALRVHPALWPPSRLLDMGVRAETPEIRDGYLLMLYQRRGGVSDRYTRSVLPIILRLLIRRGMDEAFDREATAWLATMPDARRAWPYAQVWIDEFLQYRRFDRAREWTDAMRRRYGEAGEESARRSEERIAWIEYLDHVAASLPRGTPNPDADDVLKAAVTAEPAVSDETRRRCVRWFDRLDAELPTWMLEELPNRPGLLDEYGADLRQFLERRLDPAWTGRVESGLAPLAADPKRRAELTRFLDSIPDTAYHPVVMMRDRLREKTAGG